MGRVAGIFRPMKFPSLLCCRAFVAALAALAALPMAARADDITPPVVAKPLSDLTVAAGTTASVVNLKKTFGLSGVSGTVVRFTTMLGKMDVELDAADYPLTVANFLGYVNSGRYNGSIIHRSAANFIFQGGGYYVAGDKVFDRLLANPPTVKGEHQGSNVRGTIAMALTAGSDSADTGTDEWFFNLIDNTGLDSFSNNQGPFTAFGRVIEGDLATMDAIGAVPTYDASSVVTTDDPNGGSVFAQLPLYNYTTPQGTEIDSDLIVVEDLAVVPLIAGTAGADSLLTLKAKSSNLGLVTAAITGKKLKLSYVAGQTGTARIKVIAKDSAGTQIKTLFNVTVQ